MACFYPKSSSKISLPLSNGSLNCCIFMKPTVFFLSGSRTSSIMSPSVECPGTGNFPSGLLGVKKQSFQNFRGRLISGSAVINVAEFCSTTGTSPRPPIAFTGPSWTRSPSSWGSLTPRTGRRSRWIPKLLKWIILSFIQISGTNHEDYWRELINLFVFCQPITDVYCGQLTNESAWFL